MMRISIAPSVPRIICFRARLGDADVLVEDV